MSGPLSGIRVVDLTSVVFGPLATQILGDMGADIIKVEGPEGDTTRYTGPARSRDMAALFMGMNRNKRSLVLDLKTAGREGRALEADRKRRRLRALDAAAEDRSPGLFVRGRAETTIRASSTPACTAISTAVRTADSPAYDDVIQGQSGIAALMTGVAGEPRYVPMIIADKTCALAASNAITAALLARERTGRGQFVEIPMFETMVVLHFRRASVRPYLRAAGSAARLLAAAGAVAASVPDQGRPYLHARLHRPAVAEVLGHRRQAGAAARSALREPRHAEARTSRTSIGSPASRCSARRRTNGWRSSRISTFHRARIASLDEVFNDPHLAAVGLFEKATHPTEGEIVMTQLPFRFSDTKAVDRADAAEVRRAQRGRFCARRDTRTSDVRVTVRSPAAPSTALSASEGSEQLNRVLT